MKTLLDNEFVRSKGIRVGAVVCKSATKTGHFVLVDEVACRQCIPFFHDTCDKEVLKIHATNPVIIIEHERFIKDLQAECGGVCDYLLYDDNKIAFVDLRCGLSQYLQIHKKEGIPMEGKKATARRQIEASIERMYKNPDIATYIDAFSNKTGILGYRNRDDELFTDCPETINQVEDVSLAFMRELEERQLIMSLSHGFSFMMIRYPQIYEFGSEE